MLLTGFCFNYTHSLHPRLPLPLPHHIPLSPIALTTPNDLRLRRSRCLTAHADADAEACESCCPNLLYECSPKVQTNWQHVTGEGEEEGERKGKTEDREHRTQDNKQITPRSLGCCRQKSSAAQHREECEGEREERRKRGWGAGTINYRVIRVECGSRKVV